ncbi:MAG: hypothetical protein AAFV53_17780 [Myxococcota bacterium]
MARRILILVGGVTLVLAGGAAGGVAALHEPLPIGQTPALADDLAREVQQAVNIDAWAKTGAVSWDFRGRNRHLWDRERNLVRVEWDEVVVLLDLTSQDGRATRGGQPVDGDRARALLEDAFARWANDSFWLNPLAKLFDDGTTRTLVDIDGQQGLMIRYASGGVTPGDSYVWLLGPDRRPAAWKMWVSIIPIGGVETSWEGWQTLPTGALVATQHAFPFGGGVTLSDVQAAETLDALIRGPDPFQPLFETP